MRAPACRLNPSAGAPEPPGAGSAGVWGGSGARRNIEQEISSNVDGRKNIEITSMHLPRCSLIEVPPHGALPFRPRRLLLQRPAAGPSPSGPNSTSTSPNWTTRTASTAPHACSTKPSSAGAPTARASSPRPGAGRTASSSSAPTRSRRCSPRTSASCRATAYCCAPPTTPGSWPPGSASSRRAASPSPRCRCCARPSSSSSPGSAARPSPSATTATSTSSPPPSPKAPRTCRSSRTAAPASWT